MANVLFTRTSDPNSKPVTDGQLIFDTSGNGKMYLDNGTDRLEMGGAVTVDATLSKTSTNPVQNKAVAGVMLDTLSDIGNVTSKGFLTDALAVKQLNTNVNELNNSFQASLTVNKKTVNLTTNQYGNATPNISPPNFIIGISSPKGVPVAYLDNNTWKININNVNNTNLTLDIYYLSLKQ